MNQIQVHYALQVCDVKSHQSQKRYASDDRTEISKKSIKSFLESIELACITHPNVKHSVAIINDHSSEDLIDFVKYHIIKYTSSSIQINLIDLTNVTGISESIKYCYTWLKDNGKDLVYQVQDDYLFFPNAIGDMIDIYQQVYSETGSECVVSPFNDPWYWHTIYRDRSTPRAVIVGKNGYWIQYYDMSCSFLTSYQQFNKHWDLYDKFFNLIGSGSDGLENKSLNYMLTQRGVLGIVPVNTLSFHLQSDLEKDPHIDYKPLWESVKVTPTTNNL
jgi:hypothetical protein